MEATDSGCVITVPRMVTAFYVMGVFSVSFDVFLVVNVGFNFRAAQILFAVPIVVGILKATKRAKWPIAFNMLLAWSVFVLAFIPNTDFLMRSVGYGFWLMFSAALVFATVQLYSNSTIFDLLRWYVYSFLAIAVFGIIQFVLPLMGITPPLVAQWWIPDVLARINGFSYEPSYFATYLLIGWIMVMYLLEKRYYLLPKTHLFFIALVLTVAMVLSSSRMGWVMMGLWVVRYPLIFALKLLFLKKTRYARYSLVLALCLIAGTGFLAYIGGVGSILFLLQGTGIEGTAAHSVEERSEGLIDVLRIFYSSPIIGYSLGGLSSAIGALHSVDVSSFDVAKQFEGLGVFPQVLAASGLIGFIPFVLYIATIIVIPYRLSVQVPEKVLLRCLVYALVFELIILQFNQNVLRPYLWLHIGLLSATYAAVLRRSMPSVSRNDLLGSMG